MYKGECDIVTATRFIFDIGKSKSDPISIRAWLVSVCPLRLLGPSQQIHTYRQANPRQSPRVTM